MSMSLAPCTNYVQTILLQLKPLNPTLSCLIESIPLFV
jgi:hypothetical protein